MDRMHGGGPARQKSERRTAAEYIRSGGDAADVGGAPIGGGGRSAADGTCVKDEHGGVVVQMQTVRFNSSKGEMASSTVGATGASAGEPTSLLSAGFADGIGECRHRQQHQLKAAPHGVISEMSADLLVPAASLSSGGRYQESKSSTSSLVGTFVRAMTHESTASRLAQVESDTKRSRPKAAREPHLLRSQSRRWLLSSAAPSIGSAPSPSSSDGRTVRASDTAAVFPPLRSPKVALTPHTYIHASLDRSLRGSRQSKANAFVRSRYSSPRGGCGNASHGAGHGSTTRTARGDAPSSSDEASGYWEVPFFKSKSHVHACGLHSNVSPEVRLERSIISSGRVFTWGGRHTYTRGRAGLVDFDPNRDRLLAGNANWT